MYENTTNPNLYMGLGVTEGEEYATLYVSTGTDGYSMYYHDLRKGGMPTPATTWQVLQDGFDQKTTSWNTFQKACPAWAAKFLVQTDVNAPNYRLVAVHPAKPGPEHWVDIIPEQPELLQNVNTGGGNLFASYLKDATTRIYRYALDGTGKDEIEPWSGSAGGFGGKRTTPTRSYSLQQLHGPRQHLQVRLRQRRKQPALPPRACSPSVHVRAGVLHQQGRHPGAHVHRAPQGREARRCTRPHPALRVRWLQHQPEPWFSTSRAILLENGGVFCL
ncbi:MAG: hypothetical protein R2810_05035 [Flavobacteriales bacterium]